MKGRLAAFVGVFCIALLIASGAYAVKPDKPIKPPKPEKPDQPNLTIECIVFTDNGDDEDLVHVYLEGGQDCAVVGCCPNAGPAPQYEMTLHNVRYTPAFGAEALLDNQPVLGHLFMNGYGRNAPYEGWKVQFWTCDYRARRPVGGDFFFQIRGGTGGEDKKTKVTVVKFLDDEDATLWVYYDENPECTWFEDDTCEPCLNGVQPACDPRNDPECLYPCWIEQPIDNVSFVIVRTADLTYTSGELGVTCLDNPCDYP
jgi:hypothetical protein